MSEITERRYDPDAGARLKAWVLDRMAERGIRHITKLERESGVTSATIYDFFAGREPGRDAGPRLAHALGATYRELMAARAGESVVDSEGIAEALNRLAAAQEELTRVLAAAYKVPAPAMPSDEEQQRARAGIADAERQAAQDRQPPQPLSRGPNGGTPATKRPRSG